PARRWRSQPRWSAFRLASSTPTTSWRTSLRRSADRRVRRNERVGVGSATGHLRAKGDIMGAPVVHFEIITKNAKGIQSFYKGLFDWNIDANNPMEYGMVDTKAGKGISGGIGGPPDDTYPGHFTIYVEVDDLQKTLDKVEQLGGKTVMPPSEIPGAKQPRTTAMFTDPDG